MRFNANNVEPAADNFTPLPRGAYRVRITQSIECDNKNRTGKYLDLVLQVEEGQYKGRKLWVRYTTEHDNDLAASIGRGQISAMLRAIGRPVIDHESEIIGAVGEVRVGFDKNEPERNEVKGWVTPTAMAGAPTYSNVHQRAGAQQNNIHRDAFRGGAATVPANPANRNPPAPRQEQPSVADMPGYFDDDVPF